MRREIIVITGTLEVGGTERHLVSVLPLLSAQGWSIRVIVLVKKGALAPLLEEKGIPVVCLLTDPCLRMLQKLPRFLSRGLRILFCVISLARRLRKKEDILVHFFLPEAYLVGMLGVSLAGFKGHKIMSRRSLNNYQKRRPLVAWFERKFHSKMTAIVGNSAAIVEQLKKEEGVSLDRLKLIYNGINLAPFWSRGESRYVTRTMLGISQDALVITMVANLISYKGHLDLLNALSKIKNSFLKGWCLICIGRDDGIGGSLKHRAEILGLTKHILWLGSRDDVPELLKLSDIGVLCSHEEGFSNAILESMAAGLPMVVTDVGGNKEAVIDGKTGYVVKANDNNALSQAILKLVENPSMAEQFGTAGRLRVQEHFSLEACVNAYVGLYEECFSLRSERDASEKYKCVG